MTDKEGWLTVAVQLKGSVAPKILPRVLLFGGFGLFISCLHAFHLPIVLDTLGVLTTNVVYNLVLGLLLVFRTNTSYDRFWEGRKAWGLLVINLRNLAREIGLGVTQQQEGDDDDRIAALRLLSAFAVATRLHLRNESMNEQFLALVPVESVPRMKAATNLPLEITLLLGEYLQRWSQTGQLDQWRFPILNEALNKLVEGLTSCERIRSTPLPIAYVIYLRSLTLIYCIGLPFYLVPDLGWWTGLIVAIISFILLGVEEVSHELENPFGEDINDLPLNDMCETISQNVETVIATFAPLMPKE